MGHPGVCGWLKRGHSRDLRCQVGHSLALWKKRHCFAAGGIVRPRASMTAGSGMVWPSFLVTAPKLSW